jgi:hypothetical protein
MKKVKGLVLESNEERIFLLTPEGEYLELPGNGEVLETGAEIELELPAKKKRNRFFLPFAAAAVILVFACCLVFYSVLYRPAAYLALDINPSLYFSLNGEGQVLKAEPLNEDAQEILKDLRLQGKNIREALTLILDGAYAGNYLSAEKENVILISLAAPEGFIVSEDDLRALVSERILSMEVNTYLKVATLELQEAIAARKKDMPVNSLVLGEQMMEKGLIEEEEENSPDEKCPADQKPQKPTEKKEPGPPPAVRELLSKMRPEEIFEPEEYIRGRKPKGKIQHTGPPERVPLGQAGRDPDTGKIEMPAAGEGIKVFVPPGRDKEAERNKDKVIPPERDKKVVNPPGRDKGAFVPPGLEKKNYLPPGWIKSKIRSFSGLDGLEKRPAPTDGQGKSADKNNSAGKEKSKSSRGSPGRSSRSEKNNYKKQMIYNK